MSLIFFLFKHDIKNQIAVPLFSTNTSFTILHYTYYERVSYF